MSTSVLLAVESPILRDALSAMLRSQPDIEVLGEVNDPVDLLLAVEATEAQAVIYTFPQAPKLPGICSHLFAEYPGLLVIGLSPDGDQACACRQTIDVKSLANAGLQDVLDELRRSSTQQHKGE